MVTVINLTQVGTCNIQKIALYIQTARPFQLKFEIYIFGVIFLQMKQEN